MYFNVDRVLGTVGDLAEILRGRVRIGRAANLRRFCGDSAADIRRAINLRRSCGREILRRFCEDFAEILRELGGRDFCADFAQILRRICGREIYGKSAKILRRFCEDLPAGFLRRFCADFAEIETSARIGRQQSSFSRSA